MKRTSACLAALAFGLVATQTSAQTYVSANDPIAKLISQAAARTPAATSHTYGVMKPVPDDSTALTMNVDADDSVPDEADWNMRVTLYHANGGGAGSHDALGCAVVAMRTAAVDPRVAPKRTLLYIPATVGLEMPDGSRHDGYWYVSDTGGAVKGAKVDLFTGNGASSMKPFMKINTKTVAVMKAGTFTGCPKAGSRIASR